MGIEVKGLVFRNEHETNGEKWYSYRFSVSSKDMNGNREYASKPIKFMKGITPPENKTIILLKDAWEKPMKSKDGYEVGWFVKEYESLPTGQPMGSGFMAVEQDEIPF